MLFADNPTISLPADLQTIVEKTIDVELSVNTDLSPFNITAYSFTIEYNANLLEIKSVHHSSNLGNFTNITNIQQAGKIILTGASTSKLQGEGTLITLTFEALARGTASLNFNQAGCIFNEGLPLATYSNGKIVIADKPAITITPNTATLVIGQTQQCNVGGNVTPPYTWGVTNPEVATISESGLVTATGHGKTQVFVQDNAGLYDITDGYFEVTAVKLYFPSDLEEWQGWEVVIPVKTTDFSSINVTSGQFTLSYRADVLKFLGIEKNNTLLENSTISAGEVQDGIMNLAFASPNPIGFNTDDLIDLRFLVLPSATAQSPLNFSNVVFNEDLTVITANSTFKPKILPTLSISPTSASLVAGESVLFTASNGNEPYTWTVSDERVAEINQDGLLIAKEGGVIGISVEDAVGAIKTLSNIQVSDLRMYFPVDTLESVNDHTLTRCLVDSVPAMRMAVSSIEGEISVSNKNIKILGIETEDTFTEGWQKIITPVSDQRIKFYLAGSTPFRDQGIAFYLSTELLDGFKEYDRSDISFHNVIVNEGTPIAIFVNGSIEGKIFTDQDKTICLGDNTDILIAYDTEDKEISKWQKRIRRLSNPWIDIANTDNTYIDTPDATGEWEYRAVIDGIPTKVANIMVKTIPSVNGIISGESEFCNVPQTLRYRAKASPDATEYLWFYHGEEVVLHPNKNILDLEISKNITAGQLVMYAANQCGISTDFLELDLKPMIDLSISHVENTLTANQEGASYQWLICDDINSIINGETKQSFTAYNNGSFAVEISLDNCIIISDCYLIVITGFEQNNFANEIIVHPNPTKGLLFIDMGIEYAKIKVLINDTTGKVMSIENFENTNSMLIDLPGPKGAYFITIVTHDDQQAVLKILKH